MDAPRDDIYRARASAPDVGDIEDDEFIGLMTGHFARFGEWTRISSRTEGTFMERVMPGAFDKTFAESVRSMKVLYDHGHDPQIGNKVLGPIRSLTADDEGAYYEVPLRRTSYNADLLPGLKGGDYGASFRFAVMGEKWTDTPARSDHNPDRLPERSILEAKVYEFGPVTFPAYAGATSGVRSLTDRYRGVPILGTTADLGTRDTGVDAGRAADSDDEAASEHFGMSPDERARVLQLIAQGVPIQ